MSTSVSGTPSCPICFVSFDHKRILPIVYSCGHGICIKCDENPQNIMENCHTCRKPITSRAKNYGLIEVLEIFGKQRKGTKNVHNNLSLLLSKIGTKLEEYEGTCTTLDTVFSDFKILLNMVLKNYNMCTKMAYRRRNRARRDEIVEKREEFIDEVMSIYVEVEKEMESHTSFVESTPTSSDRKLDKFKNTCDSLDQRVLAFKDLWDDTFKNCEELTEMVQNSESEERQNEVFEEMEKFIDEMKFLNGYVRCSLEVHRTNLQTSLRKINEWVETEMEQQVAEHGN